MNPKKSLQEKDFINEKLRKNPLPPWLFFGIILGVAAIVWSVGNWISEILPSKVENSPFLEVTNREMSLFLWQNPEFMKLNRPGETGYLPGFYSRGKANPKLDTVEDYVSAPPEVIFHYHTWKRLLGSIVMPRPISTSAFKEFLAASPEWLPANWKGAPDGYKQMVEKTLKEEEMNLQTLPEKDFPKDVRIAFLGWLNFYKEGESINQMEIKVEDLKKFLRLYGFYARNYWRNLYPNYLKILLNPSVDPHTSIPGNEAAPFLRSAYYNYRFELSENS